MLAMSSEEQINNHLGVQAQTTTTKSLATTTITPETHPVPMVVGHSEAQSRIVKSPVTEPQKSPVVIKSDQLKDTPPAEHENSAAHTLLVEEIHKIVDPTTTTTTRDENTNLPALVKEQLRYCATILKGLKRHPQSPPFQHPVDPIALNIPDYFEIIKNPMDLSKVSTKLEAGEYSESNEFISDVRLMLSNCFTYNHPDSQVSKMGRSLEKYFNTAISKIPTSLPPPGEEEKIRRKSESVPTPITANRARRESHAPHRLTNTPVGPSPTPRNRARSNVNPEVSFCNSVLKELFKKSHQAIAWPFLEPVDPSKLGIPDYFEVIKNPMDLSTVRRKLETGQYTSAEQFEADVRLIFSNCYAYNAPESDVVGLCRAFEKVFESKWAQRPTHFAHSTSSLDDIDSDSEKILEINRQIQALQHELNTLLMKRKSRTTPSVSTGLPRHKKPSSSSSSSSRPVSKPTSAPVITEEEFLTRPMSFEEKRQLSIEVNNLSPEKLGRVVEIIQAGMALEAQGDSDVIELDIESLNVRTLRQLQKYVMECKGITSLAMILGESGSSSAAKRKKPTTAGGPSKKTNTGPTPGSTSTPAAMAATAAAVAMSTDDEESSDEDLD